MEDKLIQMIVKVDNIQYDLMLCKMLLILLVLVVTAPFTGTDKAMLISRYLLLLIASGYGIGIMIIAISRVL